MIIYISEMIKSISGAVKSLFDYFIKKTDKQTAALKILEKIYGTN